MKILEIAENDAGQRLDKFLRKLFPQATRALLYKLNRTWKIKICSDGVNFKKQDNEYKLIRWEKIKLFLTDKDFEELSKQEIQSAQKNEWEWFDIWDIVYEDNYLLVVNKSAGVTVHPWDHKTNQISLIQQVHDYLWWKLDSLTFKPSLVHRIDRDTSWIVLIAKKKDILSKLVDDLKEHSKIKKMYYAIVLWIPEKTEWTIDAKIERIEDAKNQNKVRINKNGQKALSHYKVVWEVVCDIEWKSQSFSFVEVQIETWRMHQIRVHLAHIGHPILGDNTYGDKGVNYILGKKFGLLRQMLHAWKIEFYHYGLTRTIKLESRLKSDMLSFIKNIGGDISHFAVSKTKVIESKSSSHQEVSEKIISPEWKSESSSKKWPTNKETSQKKNLKNDFQAKKTFWKKESKDFTKNGKKQTAKSAWWNFERKVALKRNYKK
jgi:23S rRNA pseudouridine955/2504/2580 synthase